MGNEDGEDASRAMLAGWGSFVVPRHVLVVLDTIVPRVGAFSWPA